MINDNIIDIKKRVSEAARRSGRNPEEVTIVAVTKTVPVERIEEALMSGVAILGENRVQEARSKVDKLAKPIIWHLVGHLQSNKARDAVKIFSLIHSVDSLHLAEAIDKEAARINKVQDVLIQVNVSGERSKFGIEPKDAEALLKDCEGLKNIKVTGFMTIPPDVDNPEDVRMDFRRLRELRDSLNERRTTNDELRILSMGMSHDFEVAIEEGATMVRIGRGIFGERNN